MLKDLSISNFVSELASNSPAPGGGSVAALAGSLAGALGAMVFNLTIGKKVYNEYDEEKRLLIDNSLREMEEIKLTFTHLMDKDTEEFLFLMSAFKLPKETEEEKKLRSEKIQEGYKRATMIPFQVAQTAFSLYDSLNIASNYGNKNAVSDAGVGALMAQAALESAVLNVKINLACINDSAFNEKLDAKCAEIVSLGRQKRDEILAVVNSKIMG